MTIGNTAGGNTAGGAMPGGPWLRRILVTLGPLEEWRGAASGRTLEFEADGTLDGLKVTGSFQSTIMGMAKESELTVHNLRQDTRDAIRGGLTRLTVRVGYANTALHTLFQGSVFSVESNRSGTDMLTKIQAIPGYGALVRGVSSKTFAEGTAVAAVVRELAKDLPGLNVPETGIEGIPGVIGKGGWTFAGSTRDGLRQLATEYGFSWHVEKGEFRAVGDKAVFGGHVNLDGGQGGLISVTPVLSGPMQTQTGVKIQALYVPGVAAGSTVGVASVESPKLNGTYRVSTVAVSIDSHGDGWTMDIEAFKGNAGS